MTVVIKRDAILALIDYNKQIASRKDRKDNMGLAQKA